METGTPSIKARNVELFYAEASRRLARILSDIRVSDRRAESLRIGGDKIPFKFSEAAVWPIEIAEHAACAQGWIPSVRISHESNRFAIPKNAPDDRHERILC